MRERDKENAQIRVLYDLRHINFARKKTHTWTLLPNMGKYMIFLDS